MNDMKLFKVEIENLINIHSIDSELDRGVGRGCI